MIAKSLFNLGSFLVYKIEQPSLPKQVLLLSLLARLITTGSPLTEMMKGVCCPPWILTASGILPSLITMGSSPFEDELVVCVISVGVDGDSVDIIEIGLTPPVE